MENNDTMSIVVSFLPPVYTVYVQVYQDSGTDMKAWFGSKNLSPPAEGLLF